MSLILEALKKLEREKQSPDRGFLVMAHVPWAAAAGRGGRWLWIGTSLLAALVAVLAVAFFGRQRASGPPLPNTASGPAAATAPVTLAPAGGEGPPLPFPPLPDLSSRTGSPGRGPTAAGLATPPAPMTSPGSHPSVEPPPHEGPPPAAEAPGAVAAPAPQRGPTAPAGADLRLNAISQRDGRPVAILNERLVREGDIFDGILVVRIGEAEVEVEVGGKRRIVRF